METLIGRHWHHMPPDEVAHLLDSDPAKGLSLFEVKHRRDYFGPNVVPAGRRKTALERFGAQFRQPLVYILVVAALVTLFLQEYVDSLVIFGVVLVNAVVGYIQEAKAEEAIEALRKMVKTEATVIREAEKLRLSSEELVPGDVVLLQSGDKVPADMRLFSVRDLQVDESALTGESVPVGKAAETLSEDVILADRKNMCYSGTLVTYGQGRGAVVATGGHTETGRISQLIAESIEIETPLTKQIARFSRLLLWVILALAAITFATGVLRGEPAVDMFMAAVALAVGAIPEGLPAAVTIILAIGVRSMARRRAIIRKLPAVETLGSTTVICSDKTGTLTQNQMTVQEIHADGRTCEVTGGGYAPEGEVRCGDEKLSRERGPQAAVECLIAGMLCNDSQIRQTDGRWFVEGDPTEGALIVAARKAGLVEAALADEFPRLDTIPFESHHKYMATLHKAPDGGRVAYLKGAVETILAKCTQALAGDQAVALDPSAVLARADRMSARGLRVLAFAKVARPADRDRLEHGDVETGLSFLGLQGMIDPPRSEAKEAIRSCRAAGVAVKMITGDHALTATAIAAQLGLAGPDGEHLKALTGAELANLSDRELIDAAAETSVFARVAPEQKLRLVEALQARGQVVAMTGDGVNDAPALKQADIGVAMGVTGTEVAKEASDMLLTDDNFATIEAAVEEGRGVFDNLTKFIAWTLPTNMGEGLIILAAVLIGGSLPMAPVQILWINMTTAVLLGMSLAFEPKEAGIMSRSPREPDRPILTGDLIRRILLVAMVMLAGGFGLFRWQMWKGEDLATARTVVVNIFVMIELVYLFRCRSFTQTIYQIGLFSNPWAVGGAIAMILAQMLLTYSPTMNHMFHTAPIDLVAWFEVILIAILAYLVVGADRWVVRRRRDKASAE